MKTWLIFREAWLWALNRSTVVPLSNTVWMDLLQHGFTTMPHRANLPTVPRGRSKNRTASQRRENRLHKAALAMGGVVSGSGVICVGHTASSSTSSTDAPLPPSQPTWRGSLVTLPPEISGDLPFVREMLWELHELNFRLDLLGVDNNLRVQPFDESQRQALIAKCFADGDEPGFSLTRVAIPTHNVGLACEDLRAALPFVLAFVDVMKGWRGVLPSYLANAIPASPSMVLLDRDILGLVKAAASFYCQKVYDVLGRAAVLPRRIK